MWKVSIVAVVGLVACSASAPPAKPVAPPVSPPPIAVAPADDPPRPTLRLPHHFTPIGYTARVAIDPASPTFHGSIEITGDLARPAAVIWLHGKGLTIHQATATKAGASVAITTTEKDDLLELRPKTPLAAGRWVIAIDYDGGIDQVGDTGAYRQVYHDDLYVSTQFEATAARLVFPCVDEPSFKVPWQLTLDIPKNDVAISNTPALRTEPLGGDHVRVEFARTRPLPSYLVAFAVGPWEIVDAGKGKSGVPIRIVVPRDQGSRVAYAAEMMPKIVTYLEDWFGIPFPYAKLDIVAVPSRHGGAMENAGMITCDARWVLLDPQTPTWGNRYNFVEVLGHETSHQWFGDLVTAAWWDDVWLNESFATWMEDKIIAAMEPSWHAEQFDTTRRTQAFTADSLASSRKIRQSIENEGDIHNAFDNITYPKGASVLRMFEHYLGADVVQNGVRRYLVAHADGAATAKDLVAAIGEASGKPIDTAFNSFLEQAGVPLVDTELVCNPESKHPQLHVTQHRYLPVGSPDVAATSWTLPVCVAFDNKGQRGETCAVVDAASSDITLDTATCPAWTYADAGSYGYYRVALTEADAKRMRDVAWPKLTEPERRGVFDNVRAFALDGKLAMTTLASFTPKMIAIGDRFGIGDVLGDERSGLYGASGDGLPIAVSGSIGSSKLTAAQARVRATVAPLLAKLGLTSRPRDDYDVEVRRADAVLAAIWAGDRTLEPEAIALAAHWRDLTPAQRGLALPMAINASPDVSRKVHAEALAETDPHMRQELLFSLAGIHDRARLREQLDMILDPKLGAEDILAIVYGIADDNGRVELVTWLRAHLDTVKQRFPSGANDDYPLVLNLMYPFTNLCDPARRDDIAAYVTRQFATVPSGSRPVAQAIEAMDQCIARRKRLEPSIKAWLQK